MTKTKTLYDEILIEVAIPLDKASSQLEESDYELAVEVWIAWRRDSLETLIDGSWQTDDRPELPKGTEIKLDKSSLEAASLPGDSRIEPEWQ